MPLTNSRNREFNQSIISVVVIVMVLGLEGEVELDRNRDQSSIFSHGYRSLGHHRGIMTADSVLMTKDQEVYATEMKMEMKRKIER